MMEASLRPHALNAAGIEAKREDKVETQKKHNERRQVKLAVTKGLGNSVSNGASYYVLR